MGLLWPFVWTVWVLSPTASSVWGLSVSPVPSSAVPAPDTENWNNMTDSNNGNSTGWTCAVLQPPRLGSLHVEMGTGVSLGSVLVFWCPDGYQLVGSEKVTCLVKGGIPQWSNHLPVCETLPRPGNRGLRVAVMMSVASGIVILAMSVSFIMCCLHGHLNKRKESHWECGTSKRHSHRPSFWRGERWLEQEAGDWEDFHLPHRLDQSPPSRSSLSLSGFNGHKNRGYQRSQESLRTAPKPGLQCPGSQGYPRVTLHGVPTPSAPVADQAPPYLPVVSAWHRSLGTPDPTADDIT